MSESMARNDHRPRLTLCLAAAAMVGGGVAVGQPMPDYDFEWRTVGAPGNRAPTEQEAPGLFSFPGGPVPGSVAYEYRISRTEVTVGQYFEFVQAYAPYYDGALNDQAFTGLWIWSDAADPRDASGYQIVDDASDRAANMSWYMAARYVNWLNSGKASDRDAFESGVYDTSSFGSGQEIVERNPDARFWIPSLNEWVKAAHYDADRYGPGQEGYWLYPHGSDSPPITGLPQEGGQTAADLLIGPGDPHPWLDVGSYPDVQSPWGLLDLSGGLSEWLEDQISPDLSGGIDRRRDGSFDFDGAVFDDRLDVLRAAGAHSPFYGIRVAGAVPTPGALVIPLFVGMIPNRRRR